MPAVASTFYLEAFQRNIYNPFRKNRTENYIMQHVISVSNMRESDASTISGGVPSPELMLRAAKGIRASYHFEGRTAVVVGSGNNGGDGFALSMLLLDEGKNVDVITVTDHYSEDSTYYMNEALKRGLKIIPFDEGSLVGYDTIVDCLLGTGFKGDVKGLYRDAIIAINRSGSYIISADINSGMNGDSGEAGLAVKSDLTVVIGYLKIGILKARKSEYIKKFVCTDIGITLLKEEDLLLTSNEWHTMGFPDEKDEVEYQGRRYFRE